MAMNTNVVLARFLIQQVQHIIAMHMRTMDTNWLERIVKKTQNTAKTTEATKKQPMVDAWRQQHSNQLLRLVR